MRDLGCAFVSGILTLDAAFFLFCLIAWIVLIVRRVRKR